MPTDRTLFSFGATPIVVSDELLGQLGERYLALPAVWRAQLTFERYVVNRLQVRNGALFEKMRHHRNYRRGHSALRMREEAAR